MDKIAAVRNEIFSTCNLYSVSEDTRETVREILQKLVDDVKTQLTNNAKVKTITPCPDSMVCNLGPCYRDPKHC